MGTLGLVATLGATGLELLGWTELTLAEGVLVAGIVATELMLVGAAGVVGLAIAHPASRKSDAGPQISQLNRRRGRRDGGGESARFEAVDAEAVRSGAIGRSFHC